MFATLRIALIICLRRDRRLPNRQLGSETIQADLDAEGAPEEEFHAGIAERMPRKRAAGGLLIRDRLDRILFVVPTYKPTLDIPGGVADENESPWAACRREIHEELGLNTDPGRLLVVDWLPAHGVWRDGLMFVYDGGVLDEQQTATLKPRDAELKGLRFLSIEDASPMLRPSMVRRLHTAMEALASGASAYAEFGHPVA